MRSHTVTSIQPVPADGILAQLGTSLEEGYLGGRAADFWGLPGTGGPWAQAEEGQRRTRSAARLGDDGSWLPCIWAEQLHGVLFMLPTEKLRMLPNSKNRKFQQSL